MQSFGVLVWELLIFRSPKNPLWLTFTRGNKMTAAEYETAYQTALAEGYEAGMLAGTQDIVATQDGVVVSEPFPICGFANLNIRPGNGAFARWLKKEKLAEKSYQGGVSIYIHEFGQSYDRKLAMARAMEKCLLRLTDCDRIYAQGRLD